MAFIARFSSACCNWPLSMSAQSPSGRSPRMVTAFRSRGAGRRRRCRRWNPQHRTVVWKGSAAAHRSESPSSAFRAAGLFGRDVEHLLAFRESPARRLKAVDKSARYHRDRVADLVRDGA